jgi:tRNA(adenine34) deaminase
MTTSGGGKTRTAEFDDADRHFMSLALAEARQAQLAGEVPVGAIVVHEELVIGSGWNAPIGDSDPTSHAEIVALRQAARRLGNYRLPGATLYCTLEPCVMCAGAISISRIKRLVFAARDLRFGAVRSKFALADSDLLNHRVSIDEGLFAPEASEMINQFFQQSRKTARP